ncbi:c-type cytochrome [Sulfurovum sp. bin170]|nr:c-type cytochrome [Sulfurovum sp. bin170]NEW59870.1 c-type cytochrome [Sulfurovum sp. bin170]
MSSENTTETADSFLLEVEYGEMLYDNPRGISCSKCHGKGGKGGQKIAKYYDQYKNPKILKGLDITGYSFEELKASLKNRYRDENNRRVRHKIMPMYYLTDEEVKAIYSYLQDVKEK